MNIIIQKDNSITNTQPKIYDLGQISTTLQDLLDESQVYITSDQLTVLKITDVDDNVNYYLLPIDNFKNGESIYGLGQDITVDNLISLNGSNNNTIPTFQQVTEQNNVTTRNIEIDYLQTTGDIYLGKEGAGGGLVINSTSNAGETVSFRADNVTSDIELQSPNESGTIALLENISGATGSFVSADAKTITVVNGIITSIV